MLKLQTPKSQYSLDPNLEKMAEVLTVELFYAMYVTYANLFSQLLLLLFCCRSSFINSINIGIKCIIEHRLTHIRSFGGACSVKWKQKWKMQIIQQKCGTMERKVWSWRRKSVIWILVCSHVNKFVSLWHNYQRSIYYWISVRRSKEEKKIKFLWFPFQLRIVMENVLLYVQWSTRAGERAEGSDIQWMISRESRRSVIDIRIEIFLVWKPFIFCLLYRLCVNCGRGNQQPNIHECELFLGATIQIKMRFADCLIERKFDELRNCLAFNLLFSLACTRIIP